MVGIVTDGARNMISTGEAGATNRLKQDLNHVIITHDYYHALNLVIKSVMESISARYIELIVSICHIFSQSSLKAAEFKSFLKDLQENEEEKDQKILAIKRYVPTRWTSFVDCLEWILELATPLKNIFQKLKDQKAKKINFSDENIIMLRP